MTRLARLAAASLLAVALSACGGGEGPTQPDLDRTPQGDDAGLDEEEPATDDAGEGIPGQAPVEEPGDEQPSPN